MMLRQLKRLHSEEQGMALIVSLMVAFVILMLSSVIVAQSLHSLDASGYDRQRLTSYNAAEAGVNAWWEDLQTTTLASLSCSTKAGVMNTAPNEAQYSAAATFYAADGTTTMTCPFTSANPPSFVRILSTGSSEGEAAREVEAFGKLTPVVPGFGAAIMAVNGTTFNNSFTVYGNSGNNGDIYILNGNLSISNSPTVYGNVYVPLGTATTSSNNSRSRATCGPTAPSRVNNPAMVTGNAKSTDGQRLGDRHGHGQRDRAWDHHGRHGRWFALPGDATRAGADADLPADHELHRGVDQRGLHVGRTVTRVPRLARTPTTTCHNTGGGNLGHERAHQHRDPDQRDVHVHRTATTTRTRSAATSRIISDGGFTFSQQSNWNGMSAPIKNVYFISGYTAAACTGTKTSPWATTRTSMRSRTCSSTRRAPRT